MIDKVWWKIYVWQFVFLHVRMRVGPNYYTQREHVFTHMLHIHMLLVLSNIKHAKWVLALSSNQGRDKRIATKHKRAICIQVNVR